MAEISSELILSAISAMGAIGISWKVVPFLANKAFLKITSREELDQINETLAFLKHELSPNSGKSIKDSIRRIEESLDHTKSMQQLLLKNSKDAHWCSDLDGRVVWINDALADLIDCTLGEYIGNNWKNSIFQADKERVAAEWAETVKEQRDFLAHYRIAKANTPAIYVKVSAEVYGGGWLGTVSEITKEAYASLMGDMRWTVEK